MPELAEVEYMRRRWDAGLGQTVRAVLLHRESKVFRGTSTWHLTRALKGSVLLASQARGKQMLFHFEPTVWVGIHLGMTGELEASSVDHQPGRHEHFVLQMETVALVYRDPRLFGRIRFDAGVLPPDWWASLPPDLQGRGFRQIDLDRFLVRRARSPIKAVLLMQERFPGIGNWMAYEILWRSRIQPGRRAGELDAEERACLFREIRAVVRGSMKHIARPGEHWGDPPANWLFHQRWSDGGSCPKTGSPLVRDTIGGRTTCWSPAWQI